MQLLRTSRRLHVRFCLWCGYDGPELQRSGDDTTFVCTCCGADLYARPPRSYAELEGLDGSVAEARLPVEFEARQPGRFRLLLRRVRRTFRRFIRR